MGSMASSMDLRYLMCSLHVSWHCSPVFGCSVLFVFAASMNMGIDVRSPTEVPPMSGPSVAIRNVVNSPTALCCLLCLRALLEGPVFKESCSSFWIAHVACSVRNAFLMGFIATVIRDRIVVITLWHSSRALSHRVVFLKICMQSPLVIVARSTSWRALVTSRSRVPRFVASEMTAISWVHTCCCFGSCASFFFCSTSLAMEMMASA